MTDTIKGFDAATNCARAVDKITAAGLSFVVRYYSRTMAKNLSRAEAEALSAVGIKIAVVWEAAGSSPGTFTATQGIVDARDALALAKEIGQPTGSTIYVAVDFDATSVQVEDRIVPYFQLIENVFAETNDYELGVYGSGAVCQRLLDLKLVDRTWLACSEDWRGTSTFTGWHIRQHLADDPYGFGFPVDLDEAQSDFGGWMLAGGSPVRPPSPAPIPPAPEPWPRILSAGMVGPDVSRLQRLLCAAGYRVTCDGEFGAEAEDAVAAFQEAHGLLDDGVAGPVTVAELAKAVL